MTVDPQPAPLPGKWNVGRLLRRFAGVDEQLLAWVPQERPRYTGLGGSVLTTGLMAFISMFFAISQALDTKSFWVVIPALAWFVLIVNFDRWLVSTPMAPGQLRKRFGNIAMRIAMAVVFGIVIAEPLVLRVFETAILQQVKDSRAAEITDFRSRWENCNPVPPAATALPGCESFTVPAAAELKRLQQELADKKSVQAGIQAEIAPYETHLAELREHERQECVGLAGSGLTGKYGNGPVCQKLTKENDEYEATHQIRQKHTQILALGTDMQGLTDQISAATKQWGEVRGDYIAEKVADKQAHQGDIGLLERMEALQVLAAQHGTLALGIWMVRLLFILVDCAPAIVKFTGGVTSYDRLTARSLGDGELQYAVHASDRANQMRVWTARRRDALKLEELHRSADQAVQRTRVIDEMERHWSQDERPLRFDASDPFDELASDLDQSDVDAGPTAHYERDPQRRSGSGTLPG